MKFRKCQILLLTLVLLILHGGLASAKKKRANARLGRFAMGLNWGYGSGHFASFNNLVKDSVNYAVNHGVGITKMKVASSSVSLEFNLRWYSPWYFFIHTGFDTLYSKGNQTSLSGSLSFDNLLMEIPIMLGGYVPIIGYFYIYGGVGPAIQVFRRSFWDSNVTGMGLVMNDYKTDVSVGLHVMFGFSFVPMKNLAITLAYRYRNAKSGVLKNKDTGEVLTSGKLRGDNSRDTYRLDFTGHGMTLGFRVLF